MRSIFKRGAALLLALTVATGASGAALAYTTADFSDVPASHWAYTDIMSMADVGVINGVGEGAFAPGTKLSAAMFLTLVERAIDPTISAEGAASWYGPYVAAAKAAGLLDGTGISEEAIEAEITRYDMAVILLWAAQGRGTQDKAVDTGKITDYGDIPVKYADAVAQVYALGLITGDEAGRFNGMDTMSRAEAATVISRLLALPASGSSGTQGGEATTPAETPEPEPETPRTGETVTFNVFGTVRDDESKPVSNAPVSFFYKDGRLLGETTTDADGKWSMDITVDKADYDYYQKIYYAEVVEFVERNDKHYRSATDSHLIRSLNTMLGFPNGWDIWLLSIEDAPGMFPGINGIEK